MIHQEASIYPHREETSLVTAVGMTLTLCSNGRLEDLDVNSG